MTNGNGKAQDTEIIQIETNTFLMLPVSLDVVHEAGATQAQIQEALIARIMECVREYAPKHESKHVVVHCAYKIGATDYKLKMLGDGNVIPETVPSKILRP